jgi:hypothetical protein
MEKTILRRATLIWLKSWLRRRKPKVGRRMTGLSAENVALGDVRFRG